MPSRALGRGSLTRLLAPHLLEEILPPQPTPRPPPGQNLRPGRTELARPYPECFMGLISTLTTIPGGKCHYYPHFTDEQGLRNMSKGAQLISGRAELQTYLMPEPEPSAPRLHPHWPWPPQGPSGRKRGHRPIIRMPGHLSEQGQGPQSLEACPRTLDLVVDRDCGEGTCSWGQTRKA